MCDLNYFWAFRKVSRFAPILRLLKREVEIVCKFLWNESTAQPQENGDDPK